MSDLMERHLRQCRRRVIALTLVAAGALTLELSLVGMFTAWAGGGLVLNPVPGWVVIGGGLAIGLALAVLILWYCVVQPPRSLLDDTAPLAVANDDGRLHRLEGLSDGLAIAAGVPPPRVRLIRENAPNAIAVGRRPDDTTIVVTTGLADLLSRDEQEAVLASLTAAIGRYDIALGTIGYPIAETLGDLSRTFLHKDPRSWPLGALALPFWAVGRLVEWMSLRWRGEGADAAGMSFTRYPPALYTALQKLQTDALEVAVASQGTRHLWFEYPTRPAGAHAAAGQWRTPDLHHRLDLVADALRELDPTWQPPRPGAVTPG
jgi:heat shock protein HtpX